MEENRIVARHRLELARAGLNQAMGLPQEKVFELTEPADSLPLPEIALTEAIEQARSRRADLKAAEAAAEASSFAVRQAVGGYLPELAVRGRLSLHDDRFLEFDGRSTTLMGIFRWTLFDGGQTAARVARSRQERTAAREGVRGLAQQVEMEVRRAWQAVDEARARLAVAEQALASAERALTILEDRFEQGIARTTDLLDAETQAHDARVRHTQARFDLERALRTLRFAVGETPVPEVNR
jgi:outer membrane protein TolC